MATLNYWDGTAWRPISTVGFGGGATSAAVSRAIMDIDLRNPAYASLRDSVRGEVSQMLSGSSRRLPADLPWTTVRTGVMARVVAGYVELSGKMQMPPAESAEVLLRLPSHFPVPATDGTYPVACRYGASARAGYVSAVQDKREVSFHASGEVDEVSLSGVRWAAAG